MKLHVFPLPILDTPAGKFDYAATLQAVMLSSPVQGLAVDELLATVEAWRAFAVQIPEREIHATPEQWAIALARLNAFRYHGVSGLPNAHDVAPFFADFIRAMRTAPLQDFTVQKRDERGDRVAEAPAIERDALAQPPAT